MLKFIIKTQFLIALFFLLGASNQLLSQTDCENQNESDLVNFSSLSPVQSEIINLKGWAKQDNGNWLSAPNRIPFTDERTNKSSGGERKLGQDNMIALQLRKVMVGNKQYNVMVKKYYDGEYEFPVLRENWKGFKSLDFYVFPSYKLEDILPNEIPFNEQYAVNLQLFARGTVRDYENKYEDDEIVRAIQRVERGEVVNDWNIIFAVFPIKNGVTEGGSSGSPIFNNEGNIVGALTGGGASCTFLNEPDYYGKFSYSWESNGNDSTTQLSYWLDPTGTGITKLSGSNLDSTHIFADFYGDPTTIIIGESASFINTSFGNIAGYNWYFEGGNPSTSELEEPINIQYNIAGEYDVRLIISSADGVDTLTRMDYIKVLPNISPNPCNGKVTLAFGSSIPDDISIRAYDVIGRETVFRVTEENDNYLILEMINKTRGIYFIKVSSSSVNNTYKVIVLDY